MIGRVRHIAWLSLIGVLWTTVASTAQAFENPKVRPPEAAPQRRSAAEGVPPLPLPATPLRRSERKRQPAPPALVGLMNLGGKTLEVRDGQRVEVDTFPTTQVDLEQMIKFANDKLQIRYRYQTTDVNTFSWDPTELPLLYVTGWTKLPPLSEELVAKLRRYLYDGGTLVLHAQCGRPEFVEPARELIARIFPDRKLALLDSDSPIFDAYFHIETMRVRQNDEPVKAIPPLMEAVYLGCRPAILLSAVDLNCSWDVEKTPIAGGTLYHREDGLALATNIITTTLADFQYARTWGSEKLYPEQDTASRDQLVIAQIPHDGDWDPTPHALPNLMKYLQTQTTLNVQFKREVVKLDNPDVFQYPVLYMTGLRDFVLSDQEILRLRAFLQSGGVLIADAAAGRKAFDTAFRRELARVLPDHPLQSVAAENVLYTTPYPIQTVDYSALLHSQQPQLNTPCLEGVELNGQLGVIYSPVGLAAGWEQLGFAYNRGYSDLDSLRLGVNLFTYALMH